MDKKLLKIFVEKKYIKSLTEVEAPNPNRKVGSRTIIDSFIIKDIKPFGEDDFVFNVADCYDGRVVNILGSSITAIDGMEINRVAVVYGLASESAEDKRRQKEYI